MVGLVYSALALPLACDSKGSFAPLVLLKGLPSTICVLRRGLLTTPSNTGRVSVMALSGGPAGPVRVVVSWWPNRMHACSPSIHEGPERWGQLLAGTSPARMHACIPNPPGGAARMHACSSWAHLHSYRGSGPSRNRLISKQGASAIHACMQACVTIRHALGGLHWGL